METNTYRKKQDKRMPLSEAVGTFVKPGVSVAFGGMGGTQCVAHAYEIARQRIGDLTLLCESPAEPADLLIGMGLVRRAEVAWIAYAVAGLSYNYRRCVENKVPRRIELEEYSNYGMSLRFLAGAMGVPFMPTKSFLGSDFLTYNRQLKTMDDPYTGERVVLVPAARPDVALIHCSRADRSGNGQYFGISASAENIARAARHTILTCEKLVDEDLIRRTPNLTLIPGYTVDAVCEVPFACHPWNMAYEYAYDLPFHTEQVKAFRTREGFLAWMDDYCDAAGSWEGYLRRVGYERLMKLRQAEQRFDPGV
ncbi:MAG: CoA transferase [Oscillospiraceae bacterium]|nr:CoA transferase [Oscillospiraceae bacterium]